MCYDAPMVPPSPTTPPRIAYSVAEVSQALGVSKTHVYRLIRSGGLPSFRLGDRVVVPARDLNDMVEKARKGANDELTPPR